MTTAAPRLLLLCLATILVGSLAAAQSTNSSQSSPVVPRLVNFSGKAMDGGKVVTGVAGATFAIYNEESGGSPLWLETQNIQADTKGNYTVQLGATKPEGLPLDLFTSGEARWLAVTINSGQEQPRVLLLSVPYALKAADAETVGGLPPSAFMLAAPLTMAGASNDGSAKSAIIGVTPAVSGTGTTDFIPLWTNSTGALGNSVLFQSGSGSTAKVGVNSKTPASTLDVNGAMTARGNLSLPATGAATTSAGKNSQPLSFTASSYNSGAGSAVSQNFRWQAEPAGNNSANASGTLNLLYSAGANAPAETGLKIARNGQISFATGQSLAGLSGIVSNVGLSAPSSDFTVTGSPVTGSGTLALNWNTAPTSADTANAIVKRNGTGGFSAGSITATSSSSGGTGVYANAGSSAGSNGVIAQGATGVAGYTTVGGSIAVYGYAGSSGGSNGVVGYGATGVAGNSTITGSYGTYGSGSTGVWGNSTGTGANVGVLGTSASGGAGVSGTGGTYGVYGTTNSGYGVYGTVPSSGVDAVFGVSASENSGVAGINNNSTSGYGVFGEAESPGGIGGGFYNISTGDALFAYNQSGGYAAFFDGDVDVDGNLSKAGGSFKIDHPLDPANKYLYHSFVESPDMKNVYDGVATLNANGEATIEMPDWFGVLNRDFRYQLTCIGAFAPVYIAGELANNQFKIGGGRAGMRVSWQVTGIRQDPWANAHRIPVEQEKEAKVKGFYLHPELYGAPAERQIEWARHPGMMKKLQQNREQLKAQLTKSPTTEKQTPLLPQPAPLTHSTTK